MKQYEVYAAAWRKMAEIIGGVDMDVWENDDSIIAAIDLLSDGFEDQALGLESEKMMLEKVHSNLISP